MEQDSLLITVLFQDEPVESSLVCVLLDTTVYEYGYTPSDGQIKFNFSQYPLNHGYMQVTVTARNKIPYIDSIQVGLTHVEEGTGPATNLLPGIYAYPNPFSNLTNIRYSILARPASQGEAGDTGYSIENPTLGIYDVSGRLVRFFNQESSIVNQGSVVSWDGTDAAGKQVPAGVYFATLETDNWRASEKILLVR
jgi:hypothetical protein